MVNVLFTAKNGKKWVSKFPKKVTLKDVKGNMKKINPDIKKIEYYRFKKSKKSKKKMFGTLYG